MNLPSDSAPGIQSIHDDGFTVVPNVVGSSELADLRGALETAIASDLKAWHGREYSNANMVVNLMVRGKPFVRLLENNVLHSYLTPLLDKNCILYAYTSSSMPPDGTNYSRRIHVDCPRFVPNYVTNIGVTLALDDFTPENGATYFMPGSQCSPSVPNEVDFESHATCVLPKAGDAIVFNARTWHRGGVNRSADYRHAVTMNVCRSYMRQQFDFPRLVDKSVIAQLGERGRRFLGFDVRMPVSLEEYYLPVGQRPYKPNQG